MTAIFRLLAALEGMSGIVSYFKLYVILLPDIELTLN
jgi:hypothetical protein